MVTLLGLILLFGLGTFLIGAGLGLRRADQIEAELVSAIDELNGDKNIS